MIQQLARLFLCLALGIMGCKSGKNELGTKETKQKDITTKWKCNLCDEWHSELPLSYGPKHPDYYYTVPEDERSARIKGDKDFCVIDDQYYFVRGRLEIPIIDSDEVFSWDVWVSLSEKNFMRTIELIDTKGRESEEPYFGWLSNNIHLYPDTANLKTQVHTQPVGVVPVIKLDRTEHPLSMEQHEGITLERVKEIAASILHPDLDSEAK